MNRLSGATAASGARILGTGILPGLVLSVIPTILASALPDPVAITARIVSDAVSWGPEVLGQELGVGGDELDTEELAALNRSSHLRDGCRRNGNGAASLDSAER